MVLARVRSSLCKFWEEQISPKKKKILIAAPNWLLHFVILCFAMEIFYLWHYLSEINVSKGKTNNVAACCSDNFDASCSTNCSFESLCTKFFRKQKELAFVWWDGSHAAPKSGYPDSSPKQPFLRLFCCCWRKWLLLAKLSDFDPIVPYIIGKLCIWPFRKFGGKSNFVIL